MLSEILVNEKDSEFSTSMVDILNSILLTASELFDLRDSLREFNTIVSYFKQMKINAYLLINLIMKTNLRKVILCLYVSIKLGATIRSQP
jgi:hypothetical protein